MKAEIAIAAGATGVVREVRVARGRGCGRSR
jgi:biotin carboxyl carrier protein